MTNNENLNLDNQPTALLAAAVEKQTEAIRMSIELQREILEAVREIQIGDETIGQAAKRYEQKMAVVNGGRI